MESMRGDAPNQRQAVQTLAEAAGHTATVRRADRPLAVALLILALVYLLVGMIGLLGPGPGSGLAFIAVFAIGLVSVVIVLSRVRASSRIGSRLYGGGIAIFLLWNAAVILGSSQLGWWAPQTPGWHFLVSAAVAALPLLVVAAVLLRRAR